MSHILLQMFFEYFDEIYIYAIIYMIYAKVSKYNITCTYIFIIRFCARQYPCIMSHKNIRLVRGGYGCWYEVDVNWYKVDVIV